MIEWNQKEVEKFLGLSAAPEEYSSPIQPLCTRYLFELPMPETPLLLSIRPTEDHCQFYGKSNEYLSAHVHCSKITVNEDLAEEGGQCVILVGKGGHVCIGPTKPYFSLFFSMYGDKIVRWG